jgi:CRISPR/Cas system-associated endonuclease Cas1
MVHGLIDIDMHIVLNSFGTSLKKENGLFQVSTPEGNQSLSPKDIKTISISKGARISSDAVLLAIENQIDVLFVDNIGMPQGRDPFEPFTVIYNPIYSLFWSFFWAISI